LAAGLVTLFVLGIAAVQLPQGWLYGKLRRGTDRDMVLFASLWILQDWLRTVLASGYPWIFMGYAYLGTPFDGAAPVVGVYGMSLLSVLAALLIVRLLRPGRALAAILLTVLVGCVYALQFVDFTEPGESRSVSLLQGNIEQRTKWRRDSAARIQETYRSMTASEYGRDIILWPEASITLMLKRAQPFLEEIGQKASAAGSTVILGIPDWNAAGAGQNTAVAIGKGDGQYVKRRLVPFGEYVPLAKWLRGLIAFFDLPMARSEPGPEQQTPLMADGLTLSTTICYEVIYPELVRESVNQPALLVTISNDTWFGESIGPFQHLQMAQMRALENGRYMIRATNNGITTIIDHRGRLLDSLPQFQAGVLRGEVEIRQGQTPFHRFGSYPTFAVCLLALLAFVNIKKVRRLFNAKQD
ncbi:MAG: apolipoprotein N-acyltransferase, partial [Pseudomonadales bacterium]